MMNTIRKVFGSSSSKPSTATLRELSLADDDLYSSASSSYGLEPEDGSSGPSFSLTLSEVDPATGGAVATGGTGPVLPARLPSNPLTPDQVAKLMARAQDPLVAEEGDAAEFNQREKTLPHPKTGEVVQLDLFAPPSPDGPSAEAEPQLSEEEIAARAKALAGDVAVLRYYPDGAKATASSKTVTNLAITFNQPMVALGSIDDQDAVTPATLSPDCPGAWRWTGVTTLQFVPEERFPMSTTFTVSIPAGTVSTLGNTLPEPFSFSFETNPLQIVDSVPSHSLYRVIQTLRPRIALVFDQAVDPAVIAAAASISCSRGAYSGSLTPTSLDLNALIDAEPNMSWSIRGLRSRNATDRLVVFDLDVDLPNDALITLSIAAGTRGSEGPNPTTSDLSICFKTYPPFQVVVPSNCDVRPGATWSLTFTNPVDYDTLTKDMITIEPALDFAVQIPEYSSNSISIINKSRKETNYTVTVDRALRDIHGQSLVGNSRPYRVGKPYLAGSISGPDGIVTLPSVGDSPLAYPVVVYNFVSVRIRVWQVDPQEFNRSPVASYRFLDREAAEPLSIGQCVSDTVVEFDDAEEAPLDTLVELEPHLQGPRRGHLYVVVEPTQEAWRHLKAKVAYGNTQYRHRPITHAWIQVTDLAVNALVYNTDPSALLTWATHLSTGAPAEGASITVASNDCGPVDSDGVLVLAPSPAVSGALIIASQGDDSAFITDVSTRHPTSGSLEWYVYNDRHLYKPNETVTVKGYVRNVSVAASGAITPVVVPGSVSWEAFDSRNNKLASSAEGHVPQEGSLQAELSLNAFGAFHFAVTLPDNLNLGDGRVVITYEPAAGTVLRGKSLSFTHTHVFTAQEFRRPEYDVTAKIETPGPFVSSLACPGSLVSAASAQYYAGGPLSDAETRWKVTATTASYTPPGVSEFTFGKQDAWWSRCWWDPAPLNNKTLATETHNVGRTDADGEHRLAIAFEGNSHPPVPISLTAAATVVDMNNQARFAKTSTLLHPSSLYVGYKVKSWATANEPIVVQAIVVDIDGNPVGGVGIDVEVSHQVTRLVEDEGSGLARWKTTSFKDDLHWDSSADGAQSFEFVPVHGGTHSFVLTIADPDGSLNSSSFDVIVRGKEPKRGATNSRVESGEVVLIPNKRVYQAGEEGEMLVQLPFAPAQVLLTVSADGLQDTMPMTFDSAAQVVPFVVQPQWLPNFEFRVDAVGTTPRPTALGTPDLDADPMPALASGSMNLQVDPKARTLELTVAPAAESVDPGATTSVTVSVTGAASGEPVANAEVTVIVVDESVLALTGYKLSDPLPTFYQRRGTGPSNNHASQTSVLLLSAEDIERFKTQTQSELADNESEAQAALRRKERESCMKKRKCARNRGCGGGGAPDLCCDRCCCSLSMAPAFNMCCLEEECCCEGACMSDSSSFGGDYSDCCDCDDDEDDGPEADDNADELAEGAAKVKVRSRFDALAHFTPTNVTDADGLVTVSVEMPDSLTRYRVWAVAVTESEYGLGESKIVAQLPLMVRPSPPRFLNYGDTAAIPVVLQNNTTDELKVYLGAAAATLDLADEFSGGYVVSMAPGQRGALEFPVHAGAVGTGRVQWIAAAGDFTDAVTKTIPLYTPATSEATATYGDTDQDTVLAFDLAPPANAIPAFGGVQMTLSSTAVASLTDAVVYLYNYEHECCEQIASKILGYVPLLDVLAAFDVDDLPSDAKVRASLAKDLGLLSRRQFANGGFGYWTTRPRPYVTVHVGHALAKVLARDDVAVPPGLVEGTKRYLHAIDSRLQEWPFSMYSTKTKNGIRAYAAFVLARLGDDTGARAVELFGAHPLDDFSLEALGWLLASIGASSSGDAALAATKAAIVKHLNTHVNETAQTAFFVTNYAESEGGYVMLHSNRRTDAVLLEALLEAEPESDLIVKVAKGLMEHRKRGAWRNTQENAFCLVALHKYFVVREGVVPEFTASMWLGPEFAGTTAFSGRSTETQVGKIPMRKLMDSAASSSSAGESDLVRLYMERTGAGRLYYRIGVDYAPADLVVDALDRGFAVSRTYEPIDDPEHVTKDEDGVWHFAVGQSVRVRVFMRTNQRRYHVALVDQLPAGLEALNPALKGTPEESIKAGGSAGSDSRQASPFSWRYVDPLRWFEHDNIRDERVSAHRSLLWEGAYEYQYIARATTRGTFVAPAAKAECMYEPEIFGRSFTERVVVE